MAGENSGTDNPLSGGSDPHSVETAAADFSAMLAGEGDERPVRREREKPAARSPEPEGADDAEQRTERQPAKREREEPSEGQDDDDRRDRPSKRDPILDGDAPTEDKGEGEDDDNPEDDDGEADDDQNEDEDEGDDDEGDEFLDAKHTVTVNGKEVEVTGKEALQGYMRQADYTQGTERNAREYQEIEAFAEESVQHRAHALDLVARATALVEALQPSKEDMDWLKANKPDDFIKATEHWNGILAKAQELFNGRNTVAEGGNRQQQTRDAKYFETQERKLVEKLPALRDENNAKHFRQAIMDYGLKAGYSEEELRTGAVDYRDLITLYKAAKYDESQRSIREAGKRAKRGDPKPSAGGKPRAPGRGNRSAQRNADRRHQRSGSVQSAADSFAQMIRDEVR